MLLINSTRELLTRVCGIMGASAFGEGGFTLLPKASGTVGLTMADGTEIRKLTAVLSAYGESIGEVTDVFDDIASVSRSYRSGEGVMRIRTISPLMISERDRMGFIKAEQEFEIIYTGGSYDYIGI